MSRTWAIILIVLCTIFFLAAVVFMILWLRYYLIITILSGAFDGAIYNSNECGSEPSVCSNPNIVISMPTTFDNQFSVDTALFCAECVIGIEYPTVDGGIDVPDSLTLKGKLFDNDNTLAIGYVAVGKSSPTMFIVYRGTRGSGEIQEDLLFSQDMLTLGNMTAANKTIDFVDDATCEGMLVHEGFLNIFNALKPQLKQLVLDLLPAVSQIVITGHSLGGAQSSLTALYMTTLTDKPIYTYTFGKPRVGNIQYAQCLNQRVFNRFWRVENQDDLAPALPFAATPNTNDYNQPYIYEHEGSLITYSTNWAGLLLNHSMFNYTAFLQSLNSSGSSSVVTSI